MGQFFIDYIYGRTNFTRLKLDVQRASKLTRRLSLSNPHISDSKPQNPDSENNSLLPLKTVLSIPCRDTLLKSHTFHNLLIFADKPGVLLVILIRNKKQHSL